MSKPKFIYHNGEYFNVNSISNFRIDGVNIEINFDNGQHISINTGHLKMNEVVDVVNPEYNSIFYPKG